MDILSDQEVDEWKNRHLPYRIRMLDGLRWWCEIRAAGRDHTDIELTANSQPICASSLTNAVAESGLMACRFLLDFVSLTPAQDGRSQTGYDLQLIPVKKRRPNDIWAERIGCESAALDDFDLGERQACGYVHKRASQGVGHPTEGPEGAELRWLLEGARAIERAINKRIYLGCGTAVRSQLRSIPFD